MTDEEINIKIAEALGWIVRKANSGLIGKPKDEQGPLDELPDWCNDLNAMHEAESQLSNGDHKRFRNILWSDIESDRDPEHAENDERYFVSATARQRAEAFLRTLDLWTE